MLGEGARGLDRQQLPDIAVAHQGAGTGERWMGGGDRAAAQRHARFRAGPYHPVRFLKRMGHGFLGEYPFRSVMYGETGEIGAMFGVRRDGHDIRPFYGQHVPGIVIECDYAIPFPEGAQPFHIPVRGGDQVDLRPVPEGFRVG